jgi:hypothetical protein
MKRILIFTVLFPPLALLVFVVPDMITTRDFMEAGMLIWMLGWAYMVAVVPAWLTAGVDWVLSARPLYLRLVATMAVAAIMAVLSARYGFGQKGEYLYFGLMGAIPAAVCSWLSSETQKESMDA